MGNTLYDKAAIVNGSYKLYMRNLVDKITIYRHRLSFPAPA